MANATSCLAVKVKSSDAMTSAAAELLGLTESDFACPICMSMIKDPFVTDCGHSFCFQCITTHLVHKKSCPCCSSYMTADKVHPNFLLHKVTSTMLFYLRSTGASTMCHAAVLIFMMHELVCMFARLSIS